MVSGLVLLSRDALAAGCAPMGPHDTQDRYKYSADYTQVYDSRTNVTWLRCAYGQIMSPQGTRCLGAPLKAGLPYKKYEFNGGGLDGAGELSGRSPAELAREGWMIPSKDVLLTIRDGTCGSPAVNPGVFPDTPPGPFWTLSKQGRNSHNHDFYYYVNFDNRSHGVVDDHEWSANLYVRVYMPGKSATILATPDNPKPVSQGGTSVASDEK